MKSTEQFKQTIKDYLDNKADFDPLFEPTYHKEGKNIDDCITYILNTVQKSECSGFADEEIYSMAIHYYDEDTIDVGKDIDMKVVVNHKVELTEEEKAEAKERAIREIISETKRSSQKKPESKPVEMVDKVIKLSDGKEITTKVAKEIKPNFTEQTLF